jgi:outer membrane protein assembly factor BamB
LPVHHNSDPGRFWPPFSGPRTAKFPFARRGHLQPFAAITVLEFAMKRFLILTPLVAALHTTAFAEITADTQWPQWRGPLGNGVAPKAEPPLKWSESENVKWKVPVPGSGSSTPVVWGDKIFLLAAQPAPAKAGAKPAEPAAKPAEATPVPATPAPAASDPGRPRRGGGGGGGGGGADDTPTQAYQFIVLCLDRATGKTLWQKVVRETVPHEGHHKDHGFASATPVTDGKLLYVFFGSRGLYAMDFDGNIKWEKDLGKMQTRNSFGEGASPALHGDTLVVNWDHEGEDFIVAFDKTTGKELWRTKRDEPTNWTTPLIVEHGGEAQVVVNGTNRVRAYSVKNGELIWEAGGQTTNAIPSPVSGNGLLIAMSGFRGSSVQAIKLGSKGNVTGTDAIAWSYNKGTPYVPSPLLHGDELYFFGGNEARLSIFDAKTGQRHVEAERLTGLNGIYASPVGTAGRVYVTGRDGGFVVLKSGPKLEVLATNKLDDQFDATPAAVGKELFLRGHRSLYCIVEKK